MTVATLQDQVGRVFDDFSCEELRDLRQVMCKQRGSRGLDIEDLLAGFGDSLALAAAAELLGDAFLDGMVVPTIVACAACDTFGDVPETTGNAGDLENLVFAFLMKVSDDLKTYKAHGALKYTLFGFGFGAGQARDCLAVAHEMAFAEILHVSHDRLGVLTENDCDELGAAFSVMAYDGLRVFLMAWLVDRGGEQTKRAAESLSAGITDVVTSRSARRIRSQLRYLVNDIAGLIHRVRVPFTPIRLAHFLKLGQDVFFTTMDNLERSRRPPRRRRRASDNQGADKKSADKSDKKGRRASGKKASGKTRGPNKKGRGKQDG